MFTPGIFFVAGFLLIVQSVKAQCSGRNAVTFSRWSGVSPEHAAPVFVYAASAHEPSLTAACLARCRDLPDCAAVALMHSKGACHGIAGSANTTLSANKDSTYFEKICLELPKGCNSRWWALETTPGYHLHAEGRNVKVILNITATECYAAVFIDAYQQQYRSAQWIVSGEDFDQDSIKRNGNLTGNCILNAEDKFTEPESYRVTNYYTLYIENQCRHDYPEKIDRCSYEEYYNQTIKHIELILNDQTRDECKTACELEDHFVCRGFTWRAPGAGGAAGAARGECLLHSVDLLTIGSWLMRRSASATYYRRVTCLNITVECGSAELVVRYEPRGAFRGRVYVPGRGDACAARAAAGRVRLALPMPPPPPPPAAPRAPRAPRAACDVNYAHAVTRGPNGFVNRTMAYVTVMIQNNPIIQTAGDRWVRVGCSLPLEPILVNTTLAVLDQGKPSLESEASLGVAGEAPAQAASAVLAGGGGGAGGGGARAPLTMYAVRADAGGAGGAGDARGAAVALGELLELRIETADEAEIEAYHLVASSRLGDSSVLLLDSRGCPTGQVDFPEFTRVWFGNTQRLSARFKAFRFPTSHVVRFAIMVRFCERRCKPSNCRVRGRSSREAVESGAGAGAGAGAGEDEGEAAAVREESAWASRGVVAQSGAGCGGGAGGAGGAGGGRVPLELELLVGAGDLLSADTLVRADHRDTTLGMAGAAGVVCVHEAVLVSLALGWLAVQLLLLVGCCVVVKRYDRYRNLAETSMQKEYQSFDNVGFDSISTHRRVHWPDQNVEILHVT